MVKKRKLGSYPSILITFSLTAALFLIGFCAWLALNTKEMIRKIKQNVEVQVYLDKEMTPVQMDSLKKILAAKPFVATENNTPQIAFISKEATAKKFVQDTKEDYSNVLSENPFRNAFSIKIKEEYLDETHLPKIKAELEQTGGVFEADYAQGIVQGVNKNINNVYLILSGFVVMLLIAIVILVNNTIKLALYSQRFIVRSMQLVGATNGFIQKPFLKRGIIQGLIAGIIASILVFVLQEFMRVQFRDFVLFHDYLKLGIVAIILIILGIIISFFCTYQSMYRYLRMDLDELY